MANITIGSRLPHGLIASLLDGRSFEIAGLNSSNIIGADCMTTQIDADLWSAWVAETTNKDGAKFPALASGAIFEAKNDSEAKAKAKELKSVKTGLEATPQNADGVAKAD
jgi:hypothetical protein